ncbi:DUF7674 family protein [Hymenobacter sp. UYAg731]
MASKSNFIIVKPPLSQAAFLQSLVEQFPELASDVLDEDYAGLIHLQIGCMARYANQLLKQARFDTLERLFSFFQNTVDKVDSSTENALYVSFLEHVEMNGDDEKSKAARKFLQPKYLQIWRELQG